MVAERPAHMDGFQGVPINAVPDDMRVLPHLAILAPLLVEHDDALVAIEAHLEPEPVGARLPLIGSQPFVRVRVDVDVVEVFLAARACCQIVHFTQGAVEVASQSAAYVNDPYALTRTIQVLSKLRAVAAGCAIN